MLDARLGHQARKQRVVRDQEPARRQQLLVQDPLEVRDVALFVGVDED